MEILIGYTFDEHEYALHKRSNALDNQPTQ